nr:DUF4363 family protein [Clostridia bacterium]
MVKSVISMVIVALILAAGVIYETTFIRGEFTELTVATETLYDKIESETATENDVYVLQNKWVSAKEKLHAFISHNEIREFDMWIAETVNLVAANMWDEALSKTEVILELEEQIPKNFNVSFANIF